MCLLVCLAFRRVTMLLTLHSRCPSYASDFWLDCGLASALLARRPHSYSQAVLTLICSPLQKTPLALRRCLLNATTTHSVVVLCASTDDVMIPDPKLTVIGPFTHENYDIMTEGLLTLLFCPSSSRHRVDQMQPNIMQQNV